MNMVPLHPGGRPLSSKCPPHLRETYPSPHKHKQQTPGLTGESGVGLCPGGGDPTGPHGQDSGQHVDMGSGCPVLWVRACPAPGCPPPCSTLRLSMPRPGQRQLLGESAFQAASWGQAAVGQAVRWLQQLCWATTGPPALCPRHSWPTGRLPATSNPRGTEVAAGMTG